MTNLGQLGQEGAHLSKCLVITVRSGEVLTLYEENSVSKMQKREKRKILH
jgi:hypothetical protein